MIYTLKMAKPRYSEKPSFFFSPQRADQHTWWKVFISGKNVRFIKFYFLELGLKFHNSKKQKLPLGNASLVL